MIVAKVHNVAGDNLDRDDVVCHLIMRPSSVQNRIGSRMGARPRTAAKSSCRQSFENAGTVKQR